MFLELARRDGRPARRPRDTGHCVDGHLQRWRRPKGLLRPDSSSRSQTRLDGLGSDYERWLFDVIERLDIPSELLQSALHSQPEVAGGDGAALMGLE